MSKNRVEVVIDGITYPLVSEDSPEYIKKVAALVDEKMSEIGSYGNCLTNSRRAVLTAINIADDFLKRSAKVREVLNENDTLKKRIKELESKNGKR